MNLNIVVGADIENLKKGFNAAVVAMRDSGKQLTGEASKTVAGIQERFDKLASGKLTGRTVQQLTMMSMEVRALGPEFAKTADTMIRKAGAIKDSIGDTQAQVKYFASDTRRLDAVVSGITGLAGAFSGVQGAAALFGGENKALQETMVKLQGAMALVQGLTAVQNALQAESALMVGLQTAAVRIQTFVMGQATTAARVYNAALLATGAGIILAGIALIYAAMSNNTEAAEKAAEAQKKYNDALEQSNDRAVKFVERQLAFREQIAIKNAQIQNASDEKIAQIELVNLNKRLAAYKTMHNSVGEDSKLLAELSEKIQTTENEITLKGLDIKIAARKAEREEAKKAADQQKKLDEDQLARIDGMLNLHNKKRITSAPIVAKPQSPFLGIVTAPSTAMDEETKKQRKAQLEQEINQANYEERMVASATQINQAFNNLTAQGLQDFGTLLGDIMSGQINSFDDFGKRLLTAISGFMQSFGKSLILTATASKAFKELLIKNPVLAAAAGVALIAGAAVINNMLKKGPQATAFAKGGIISGPTLGLMGEYPNARNNPEVVAPLDKLKLLMKPQQNDGGYIASTRIQGRDLELVLERYKKDSQRG